MAEVRLEHVGKRFGRTRVLEDVSLTVAERSFTVFVGPSGCGKSTLLRLIAGLEDVTTGDLFIAGRRVNEVPPAGRGVAMVFQSYALYPHMTVYDNMAFGLRLAKTAREDVAARVRRVAQSLQLDQLLDRLPRQLSGGQRQRVAIGRAIVREPGVFLFDEPLSNLDAALRVQMRLEIARLHTLLPASMIYVTHDQVEAMTLADTIVLLNTGPAVPKRGSVAQIGPPLDLYHHPRDRFVASFIGSPRMNFREGELVRAEPGLATVQLADGVTVCAAVDAATAPPGSAVTVGIRPEHCILGGAGENVLRGRVAHVEYLGKTSYLYVETPGAADSLVASQEGDTTARPGDLVEFALPPGDCHLFAADDRAFPRHTARDQAPSPEAR